MIRPALLISLALLTAACGDKDTATANDAVADVGLEQEDVITNDVTAIDAATADTSGMAADLAPPSGNEVDAPVTNGSRRERRQATSAPAAENDEAEPAATEAAEPDAASDNNAA